MLCLQRQELLLGSSVAQRHVAVLGISRLVHPTVVAGGTSANMALESSSSGTTPRIARRTVFKMDFARRYTTHRCPQESMPLPLLFASRAQKVNRVAVLIQHFRALHMLEPKAAKDLKIGHHQGRRSCSVVLSGMCNCFQ